MTLQAKQAHGHVVIDAAFQEMTKQIRDAVKEGGAGKLTSYDAVIIMKRIEAILGFGEVKLASQLKALADETQEHGRKVG